jgi:hypothetical protein
MCRRRPYFFQIGNFKTELQEEEEEVLQSNTSIHKITVRNCIAWENGVCTEQQTQEE